MIADKQSLEAVWQRIVAAVSVEGPQEVIIKRYRDTKTREMEKKYHAQIRDIAKQYRHAGREWDEDSMKRLMIDAFKHATKDDPDYAESWRKMGSIRLVPAIGHDGFVALGEQSRKFDKNLATGFIEFLNWFMAENNIEASKE